MILPSAKCLGPPLLSLRRRATELWGHGGQIGEPLPDGITLEAATGPLREPPSITQGMAGSGLWAWGMALPQTLSTHQQTCSGMEASKDGEKWQWIVDLDASL